MDRRGFFSSLFRSDPTVVFVGAQFVIATVSSDTTRVRLRSLMERTDSEERPQEKRAFYKNVAALLLENQPYWEYGYWDYLTDADEAESEFHDWLSGIQASMATEDEEIGAEVDEVHRLSADKSYIVVTVQFLLEYNTSTQQVCEALEEIPEEEYFTHTGFKRVVEAIKRIDFEYSLRDAIFVLPGNDSDGFSWEDLHGEGWEYLKPLSL